ncbi:uncharacterized protein LOC144553760 [Carex rostrata]
MEHFRVEPLPLDGLRYENYKLTNDDFMIAIDERRTTLVTLQVDPNFAIYPTPQPIDQIKAIPRGKYLTDVLGQVSYAHQVNFVEWRGRELVPSVKIYLFHPTGTVIPLLMVGKPFENNPGVLQAIEQKSIIFVTRVKVLVDTPYNHLLATDISTVHFNPQMPEYEELRLRLNMP